MPTDTSNTIFQQAVAFVNQTSQHLFLTGKAGTGKTTFLKHIRENCFKKLAIVAPTGVAAINAGGVTIHSFFQLPFGTYLPTFKTVWGGEFQNVYNKNQLLGKVKLNSAKRDLIRELDLLIIDEVSMVRADIMDALDALLRSVRRRAHEPFGGVQLLLIGDMFQLPPVVKDSEREMMEEYYEGPFFFHAHSIKEAMPVYIELKKIYRQKDTGFIALLNNIRNNDCTYDDLEQLDQYYQPHFSPEKEAGFITLTTHNYKADAINQRELEKLPGQTYQVAAKTEKEFPEHAYPAEKILYLKEGAQIMFIKNDKGESRRYYNGKIGTISRIEDSGKRIFVVFPEQQLEMEIERETWRNIKFNYDKERDEIKEEELGTFQQFPIRLAWAITIHKSQGLTFEKAVVDAGQAFAPGQVYVALSRLTRLDGLVLHSRILADSIRTDERILDFSKSEEPEERLEAVLIDSQKIFTEQSLLKAFNWDKLTVLASEHLDEYRNRVLQEKATAVQWALAWISKIQNQKQTADKFIPSLNTFFSQGKKAHVLLHDRTTAAVQWFVNTLEEQVIVPLREHIQQQKQQPRNKKYVKELQELSLHFERKKYELTQATAVTEALALALDHAEVMKRVHQLHSPLAIPLPAEETPPTAKAKAATTGETKQVSLKLFKEGKTIAEIAQARGMVASTIEGHLSHFIATGEVESTELVPLEKLTKIMGALKKTPEATSTLLREQLGSSYSYSELKAAMAFWHKENDDRKTPKTANAQ